MPLQSQRQTILRRGIATVTFAIRTYLSPTPNRATLKASQYAATPSRERSDPPDAEGATAPRKLSGKRTATASNLWREMPRKGVRRRDNDLRQTNRAGAPKS
jgi:hypothetical protein